MTMNPTPHQRGIINGLASTRVVVMGLGRFGGGVGVTRFLVDRGADVLVTDQRPADQLRDSLAELADLPVQYRLGGHNVSDFTTADLVVVNPAVDRRDNRFLRAAAAGGIAITSEIQLLLGAISTRRVIAVTGTAGKSTTTAMIGHILTAEHGHEHVHVGGNLGGSLLDRVDRITADDWVVLELSSFMLEAMKGDRWSPHVAVVTNLSPNHLDRHGTMEAYAAVKQVLLDHQGPDDHAVQGPGTEPWFTPRAGHIERVEAPPVPRLPLRIPGTFNQINATMAIEAAACAGVSLAAAIEAVSGFSGLPHRLQLVAEVDGVRYFNDSKATTPAASQLVITELVAEYGGHPGRGSAEDPGGVHVILGGFDKQSNLTGLAQLASRSCRGVYTIGATGPKIAAGARQSLALDAVERDRVVECETLQIAVEAIRRRVHPGDTVLLSPGCASWDQFDNYEKRGEVFAQLVRQRAAESL